MTATDRAGSCFGQPTPGPVALTAPILHFCASSPAPPESGYLSARLRDLPAIADAFAAGSISYSKVRTLTRIATQANEQELLDIALEVPAAQLGRALALWQKDNTVPEELEAHQRRQRSIKWRTEAD